MASGLLGQRERAMSGEQRERAGTGPRARSGSLVGRCVVVAVDASDNAKYAFEYYLENIRKADDLIVLVHCPETPRLPSFKFKSGIAPPVDDWKKVLDEMNSKSRQIEEDYEGTLVAKKLKYKVRGESSKKPGEAIVKIIEDERANLAIIGTRGMGAVKRAFIGSVSEFVVRNSGIPTLVIPAPTKGAPKK